VTWGDVKAQVNTNTYGLSKFAELFGKYGVDAVLACWSRWMDICETELRKQIAAAPDGRYGPETDYLDDDGVDLATPHRISASLEIKGDTLHFILNSDAQARGPINLRPCVSRNFIECLVKMIFIPDLPVNDGLSRPVRVSYPPEGSLLNPRFPAPVNMYVRPSQVTTSVIMRVLAQALPGRVPAPGSAAGGSLSSRGPPSHNGPLVFAVRNSQRRHGSASRGRRGERHGRARRQRDEYPDRSDRNRVSHPRRTL
jgi:N-methylhydantoinase B